MPATARQLRYGTSATFDLELPAAAISGMHYAPESLADVAAATTAAIAEPLEYPALREAVVPGDRVVIVLQNNMPEAPAMIAAVWSALSSREVAAEDVTILQPPRLDVRPEVDPRSNLPESVAEAMNWRTHDPLDESGIAYLATSSGGERVYLSSAVCDADFVLPIGVVEYDAVLGYQGTAGGLFPALSNLDAIKRHGAIAHAELTPDHSRTARVVADEVGWLLGTQFHVQAVRGAGGGISQVLAGLTDAVFEAGKQGLREGWRLELPRRADLVFATVDAGPTGTSWHDVVAAADAAARLVHRGGRIVLLSDLKAGSGSLSDAMQIIAESATIEEARTVLPQLSSADVGLAMRLLGVLERAQLFLLADLPDGLADDLFMNRIDDEAEARRLLTTADEIAILEGGQHVQTRISD